jgi:DNA-binding NtrC family response regulator
MALFVSGVDGANGIKAKSGANGVLVVDDEETMHTLSTRILGREEIQVYSAVDKHSALKILAEKKDEIALALVDVLMPDIEGPELAASLLAIKPNLKLLFFSGYGVTQEVQTFIDRGQADFIAKPFTRDDILAKIKKALN